MDQITNSLSEYSATVNEYAEKVSGALIPIATILILTFFLVDMFRWNTKLGQEGGKLTAQIWAEISLGYILAIFLVMNISAIFDVIVFVFNKAIGLINEHLPDNTYQARVDTSGINGWVLKQIVEFVAWATTHTANIVTSILLFMRFFQMYVLKAVAPIVVAFFMAEQTRTIAINFVKHFAAYAFQGLLLVIIISLYPALVTEDLFKAANGDTVTAFASIAKSIVYIVALFSSQKLAKTLLNVM